MIGTAPLGRFFRHRLSWWLLTLLLLLLAALLSFYIAFPRRTLQARLEMELARTGVMEARLSPPQLLFPPGLACSQVDLVSKQAAERSLPLRQVRVTPLWFSWFGSSPGLRFQALLNGGALSGTIRRNGQATLVADQVVVQEALPINGDPSFQGVIQNSRFSGLLPLQIPGERNLTLNLDGIRLTGLESYGVPDGSLDLGQLALQAEGQGTTLRIRELSLRGGVLEGSGQGTILVGASPATTRLNLTLQLRPGAALEPSLRDLLLLIGSSAPDGSRRLRLSGSLQQPTLR